MLPVLGGMLLLLDQQCHARFGRLFVSGVLFGLAVVMKQPGIFFSLFAVIYLLTKGIVAGCAQRNGSCERWSLAVA